MDLVEFPLRIRGLEKQAIERKAKEIAQALRISDLSDKYPAQPSGGEMRRVAIARALVKDPRLLLLDEPFSNLDARIRAAAREYIKKIRRELGITTVLVTHDQADAFAVADGVMVLNRGEIAQTGTPQDLYEEQANAFVADFTGYPPMNMIKVFPEDPVARVLGINPLEHDKKRAEIGFRPGEADVLNAGESCIEALVKRSEYQGSRALSIAEIRGGESVRIVSEKSFGIGEKTRQAEKDPHIRSDRKEDQGARLPASIAIEIARGRRRSAQIARPRAGWRRGLGRPMICRGVKGLKEGGV